MKKGIASRNNPSYKQVYDKEEQEFVARAMQLIGEGALVINQPNDGSGLAYGVSHLVTYYRDGSPTKRFTDAANTIRLSLDKYASDETVRDAVLSTGAEYLLLLDQGVAYEDGTWLAQYKNPEQWEGINAITDDTPGFEVILADGEMRLYRILKD